MDYLYALIDFDNLESDVCFIKIHKDDKRQFVEFNKDINDLYYSYHIGWIENGEVTFIDEDSKEFMIMNIQNWTQKLANLLNQIDRMGERHSQFKNKKKIKEILSKYKFKQVY